MPAPLLYRPGSKWPTVVSFASALLIHAGAVAIAELKPRPIETPPTSISDEQWIHIEPEVEAQTPPPPAVEDVDVAPPPPPVTESDFIDDDSPTPPPRRVTKAAPPIVRPAAPAAPRGPGGSPKAYALTAPRPEYPYEARRQRLTGSGIATLTIDSATGTVTNVTMSRSTGSPVLDNATISGFQRWRFRPGTVSRVQTPITYTLTGATY